MGADEQLPPSAQTTTEPGPSLSNVHFAAFLTAVITLVVCSREMVPGWGIFHLSWERSTFYFIAATVGAIAGAILAPHRLPGLISGALTMTGALFCSALVLDHVDRIPTIVLVIVEGIGAIPGFALYLGYAWVYNRMFGKPGSAQDERGGVASGEG
jgi:hypothetical protein